MHPLFEHDIGKHFTTFKLRQGQIKKLHKLKQRDLQNFYGI